MVLVQRIRKRGANIVVEANAEVLFAATGQVGRWSREFSLRGKRFTAGFAPNNKRPRWAHYGPPLKTTFRASTTYQPNRLRVYSAIGSTAPHAVFPDQGTGVYVGNAPWAARVLPPYTQGSPSLYEATWKPPGAKRPVSQVMIKGQRPQYFFARGLDATFKSMRLLSLETPGAPGITEALNTVPSTLTDFLGNTPDGAAFRASLTQWRAWRDEAFNSGRVLGRNSGAGTREAQRRREEARDIRRAGRRPRLTDDERRQRRNASQRQYRERKAQVRKPSMRVSEKADRSAFLSAMRKKYGNVESASLRSENGYWYVTVRVTENGRNVFREVRAKRKSES